jgi:flavin-dependent dehydrogenase
VEVPFKQKNNTAGSAAGYVCRRYDFDNFLMKEVKNNPLIQVLEETSLDHAVAEKGGILLTGNKGAVQIFSKMVIVASGAQSVLAKKLSGHLVNPSHHMAGVRAYFRGVEGIHPGNYIELHFLKNFLPGYFWIFPLPGGYANVGAGIKSDVVSREKINLREELLSVIKTNPVLKDRFRNAVLEGRVEGYGLPLGSKKRKVSGERFMLAGDAASLIDPFTGEGIGNAMLSGMYAADQAEKCLRADNYSASFLQEYDRLLYGKIGRELQISTVMQKLLNYPRLFNFVIGKASRNETLRDTISCMLTDLDVRERLKKPSFYFRLLFG